MEKKKTFKELFAGTGIEPTTNENGGVDYNFNATLKNKPMKLYAEEQIKILLNALTDIKNWNEELEDEWEDCGYRAIDALNNFSDVNEIELPSDEDIKEKAQEQWGAVHRTGVLGFIDCAKWMKEQILNQNK